MGLMRHIGLIGHIGFIGLIGLISLMSSCRGGDDLLTPTPEPEEPTDEVAISFSGNESKGDTVTRAATRAGVPLSEAGVLTFKVWGFKNMAYDEGTESYGGLQTVFPGYNVNWEDNSAATTTSNSSGWEYVGQEGGGGTQQTIKFWDWSARAYRFLGATNWGGERPADPASYVENRAYGALGASAYEITIMTDASPEFDGEDKIDLGATATKMAAIPYYTRLWFSTGKAEDYPTRLFGQPVQLEFVKPYTRVRFIFIYTFPREGIGLTAKSFKPTDGSEIVRKGTVTLSFPLTGTSIAESFNMTPDSDPDPAVSKALTDFTEDCDPEDDSKVYTQTEGGWYSVLPNNTQGSYTLTVNVNGAPKSATVPAEFMQWSPGYSYTYIFKITDEGGVEIGWVEYAMTPWTEMETIWSVYNW